MALISRKLFPSGPELRVRDVTVSAHDDFQTQRSKLATIMLDAMFQYVGLLDIDGRMLEINRAALDGIGIQMDDIRGKPFWEARWWIISAETQNDLRELIRRAAQGELTVLASGSKAAFARARPALEAMSAKLYELGDEAGQGAAFKMINQLLAGVHIAAASEAIAFAAKQGLDIRKVYEVITASAGNSWMFENRMPHVLDGDYTPRSAIDIFVKDLGIIQDMARTAKFPVPVSAAALQMFLMTSASGMGRDDDASVARMYARVTGTKLPGDK